MPKVLLLPPEVRVPSEYKKHFDEVITADTAEEARDILLSKNLSSVFSDAKLLSIHRKSDTDRFLIVNYGEDFTGDISLNFVDGGKTARVYDTETGQEISFDKKENTLTLKIEKGKSIIVEMK